MALWEPIGGLGGKINFPPPGGGGGGEQEALNLSQSCSLTNRLRQVSKPGAAENCCHMIFEVLKGTVAPILLSGKISSVASCAAADNHQDLHNDIQPGIDKQAGSPQPGKGGRGWAGVKGKRRGGGGVERVTDGTAPESEQQHAQRALPFAAGRSAAHP